MPPRKGLGGGTGDIRPQWMTINNLQSAANTTRLTSHQTPVLRVGGGSTKNAQIMEVLKVYFELTRDEGDTANYSQITLSTKPPSGSADGVATTLLNELAPWMADPSVFAYYRRNVFWTPDFTEGLDCN